MYNRLTGVLPILYLSKRGSSETIAGSGYRVGSVPVQSLLVTEYPAAVVAAKQRKLRLENII